MNQAMPASAGLSDFELMLGLKNGERDSMEPLLGRHRGSLMRFLYRRVQNVAVAEELTQDVFLKVFRARDAYLPSAHFTTWLYRIALNRAINWVRDNRHQRGSRALEPYVAKYGELEYAEIAEILGCSVSANRGQYTQSPISAAEKLGIECTVPGFA